MMPFRRAGLAGAALLCALAPVEALAQTQVELDHVFIVVPSGDGPEVQALRDAGFFVADQVTRHQGQGTASRSYILENAYFEVIWIDSTVRVDSTSTALVGRMRDAAASATTGTSPFGLGLRRVAGAAAAADYGVPVRAYRAAWMAPGSSIELLHQDSEPHSAEVFVVPAYMALPSWIGPLRRGAPHLLAHVNGATRLRSLAIHGPRAQQPVALRTLAVPGVMLVAGTETLLVLEMDGLSADIDLRPALPVLIRR